MSIFIKNTDGKRDAILTLLVVSFFIHAASILFGGSQLPLGIIVAKADAGIIAAFFGTLLAAYVARRNGWGKPNAGA